MAMKHYEIIKCTLQERMACMDYKDPFVAFRRLLEARGILHSKKLGIQSWIDGNGGANVVRCYRNYEPQTDVQIAGSEKGVGRIDKA